MLLVGQLDDVETAFVWEFVEREPFYFHVVNQRDFLSGSIFTHQFFACLAGIGGAPDERDNFVDVFDRHGEAAQDMYADRELRS